MSNALKSRKARPGEGQAPEIRRLSTLLEVSQALSGTLNLKSALHRVLEILARHHGAVRGIVTLLHEGGELRVEASDGLEKPAQPVSYRVGEGITGRVVESGKPIVVPRVSREPAFLHRAARRPELPQQELSFVCVPIMLNRTARSARWRSICKFKAERDFDRSVKFLGVVASMIAQAIKIQRLIEEDKRRLRGREHAPAPGAARALRLLEHRRHQRADAVDLPLTAGRLHARRRPRQGESFNCRS